MDASTMQSSFLYFLNFGVYIFVYPLFPLLYSAGYDILFLGGKMLKNKKIVVVATTDNMIWQFLIPHIKHLQELGNEVECVCAKTGFWFDELREKYGFVMHNISFTRNPISLSNIKGFKQLVKLQKERQFDLVYCQQPVGGVMGRKLAKKFKIPCIYTAHGFHFFKGNNPLKNLIFKTIEKHYSRYTTALVTINEEDYLASQKFYAKKTYKINGIGVDLAKYGIKKDFNRDNFRKELGLEKEDFVVISVGELNKNKNTFRLLEVMKDVPNNIKYIVCGQGPLKNEYIEYIKLNNLEQKVKMLGFRKDIPELLSISNVFIMPSYREGLSKSMMEAMSIGLPIIASKIRGNVDLVTDEENGFLCNVEDNENYKNKIIQLAQNKLLQEKFSKANKKKIKNYSIENVLEQLGKVYEEMEQL